MLECTHIVAAIIDTDTAILPSCSKDVLGMLLFFFSSNFFSLDFPKRTTNQTAFGREPDLTSRSTGRSRSSCTYREAKRLRAVCRRVRGAADDHQRGERPLGRGIVRLKQALPAEKLDKIYFGVTFRWYFTSVLETFPGFMTQVEIRHRC